MKFQSFYWEIWYWTVICSFRSVAHWSVKIDEKIDLQHLPLQNVYVLLHIKKIWFLIYVSFEIYIANREKNVFWHVILNLPASWRIKPQSLTENSL